ncbi:YtpI family protein [Planococcus sp. N028]|uniref:YtpI family protein n=1 Tax=Planococcus shixiaomingii TaxID=3058393 RepID=A0ABT8MX84_9BACL|nr:MULTISPECIES: YtpI family protein [unclassified Planococcus (in: firmicutes)]MDN7240256.1 YtpI family protein [Planococcus sp. N028]WKA56724.1 YtpI family protein [Planococcus sp. N022]
MLVFLSVILITLSFAVYFYYKTKQFRTSLPIRKKWYTSMASVALGSFVMFFGINQLLLFHTVVTYIIAGIFVILGLGLIVYNFKAAKHYKQFLAEEARLNK